MENAGRSVTGSRSRLRCFTRIQRHCLMLQMAQRQQTVPASQEIQELLPGLVNDIVLDQILPRLPWYQRPVMMAVSKLWYSAIASSMSSPARLLQKPKGLLLFYSSGDFDEVEDERIQHSVFALLDSSTGTWHELPPVLDEANVFDAFCVDGCLLSICNTRVYELDLPAGSWTWKHIGNASWFPSGTFIQPLPGGGDVCPMFVQHLSDVSTRTFVSETECYSVRAWIFLEYFDSAKRTGGAIILGKKLRLTGKFDLRCLTHDSEFLYVLLHSASGVRQSSGHVLSFSLWKAAYKDEGSASCRQANELEWHKMECPLTYGDYPHTIGLKALL